MRVSTPTDDSSLAGSTFELISGNDVESHDENYTESISESIGSLDFHRSDDVQSLAGTEHTYDDESLADEEAEVLSYSVAQEETSEVHNDDVEPAEASDGSESEEEARSRCSLEYTQHSLKTPSILTPEASKIIERSLENSNNPETSQATIRYWKDITWEAATRAWDYTTDVTSAALPGLLFAVAFSILIPMLYPSTVEFTKPPETVVTTTITATTTPLVIYTKEAAATAPARQQTTSVKGMGLISISDKVSDEWLFGSKKPEIQFTPLGQGFVMVHVPLDVKKTWVRKKNCLSITAMRAGEAVEMQVSSSELGFLVKFPKKETHGVVKLFVEASCRPAVTKMVKVHFGKGIMEEAYEMTKNLAHDISELVPVAAQEAERCLVEAKKSFEAVSDTVTSGMVTVSDSLMGRLKTSTAKLQDLFEGVPSSSVRHAQQLVCKVPQTLESVYRQVSEPLTYHKVFKVDIQDGILDAQLYLLRTRISAKMWWLKATGQTAEHAEYGEKAKDYVANKQREGKDKIREQSKGNRKDHVCCRRSKRSRCKKYNGKGRNIHLCKVDV